MTVLNRTNGRARDIAPVLSVVLIMLLPMWMKRDSVAVGKNVLSDAEVVESFRTAPFRIGRWIGADVPLPEAAGRQLKPTAALSRRYVHMDDGYVIDVTIIQSGDARDMVGHHPPICYPSNGWVAVDEQELSSGSARGHGSQVELRVAGSFVESQRYEFIRSNDIGDQLGIRIFNFFVLPGGIVTPSINDVHRQTSWLRADTPGVAQVQVLTRIDLPESVARDVTGEILGGLSQVFEAVGVKFNGASQ